MTGSPHIKETSPRDKKYNCIAWAAGDTDNWWWPSLYGAAYWPAGVPKNTTLDAFIEAFATIGYIPCSDGFQEVGYTKISFFSNNGTNITHAARQLNNGFWTSKLGKSVDVEHGIDDLKYIGDLAYRYGEIIYFMKRKN